MANNAYLISFSRVRGITRATTDEQAAGQLAAVTKIIEDFFGVVLFKTDFTDEKITVPYESMRIIRPAKTPINSVTAVKFYDWHKNEYKTYAHTHFVIGNETIEFKEYKPWYHGVTKVLLSYNAGLYDDISQVPPILAVAAEKLLDYLFVSGSFGGAYQSEHLGDYSYSKAALVGGLPADIAGLLQGLHL